MGQERERENTNVNIMTVGRNYCVITVGEHAESRVVYYDDMVPPPSPDMCEPRLFPNQRKVEVVKTVQRLLLLMSFSGLAAAFGVNWELFKETYPGKIINRSSLKVTKEKKSFPGSLEHFRQTKRKWSQRKEKVTR